MKNVTFLAGILGALLFISASILGGLQIEGYSFIRQFISESYATGIPNTTYLRYMYMSSGVLLALFGFLTPFVLTKIKLPKIGYFSFAIFYGFGTLITGFFPCDFGCPSDGDHLSISQFIHNTAGFLVYAVVPFCLIGIGFFAKKGNVGVQYAKITIICAVLAFAFVVLLFSNPNGPFIGLFQRFIEASILFWVIYTALYIRRINN